MRYESNAGLAKQFVIGTHLYISEKRYSLSKKRTRQWRDQHCLKEDGNDDDVDDDNDDEENYDYKY